MKPELLRCLLLCAVFTINYEASKKIRTQHVTIPIIALTANLRDIEQTTLAMGINDIIVKPFCH